MASKKLTEFLKRLIFTIVFIAIYITVIYSGPIVIMFALLGIQVKCYCEIINIGYSVNKIPNLPNFRLISWYILSAGNFFFYTEIMLKHYDVFTRKLSIFQFIVSYHRFIAFCLYFSAIVWFITNIVRKYRLRQYKILAWTHLLLAIIVFQSYLLIENMFKGLIWLVLSTFLVIVNDVFAYVFGRLFGRTPLIKVSPKKTWEGFVGGAISTIVFGLVAGHYLCKFEYFVCPIKYVDTGGGIKAITDCSNKNYIFELCKYQLFSDINIQIYPFLFHSVVLSLFASIIAPFGGFFASAFKRSLNVKDFADTIPGHGGFVDRFDCQYLMGAFVNVYLSTLFRNFSVENIFHRISKLDDNDQLSIFFDLRKQLELQNML